MRTKFFLPGILWFALIFWIISVPGSSIPQTPLLEIPHFDKLVHFGLFTIFVIFLNFGFYKQNTPLFHKYHYNISLLIGVLYGAATEILQHIFFVSRHGNLADFVANTLGCILGTVLFFYMTKNKFASNILKL